MSAKYATTMTHCCSRRQILHWAEILHSHHRHSIKQWMRISKKMCKNIIRPAGLLPNHNSSILIDWLIILISLYLSLRKPSNFPILFNGCWNSISCTELVIIAFCYNKCELYHAGLAGMCPVASTLAIGRPIFWHGSFGMVCIKPDLPYMFQ